MNDMISSRSRSALNHRHLLRHFEIPAYCLISLVGRAAADVPMPNQAVLPRQELREASWYFNWPGGALFHIALHEGVTTRYLLLKEATRSEVLRQHLRLSDEQVKSIDQLVPIVFDRSKLADQNSQPDEQKFDKDFFSFLKADQLQTLDVLALRLDGYCALTRGSLAASVELSDESKQKIVDAVAKVREDVVIPEFQWAFAGKLPGDYKHEEVLFVGGVGTYTNMLIVELLTDEECDRLYKVLQSNSIPENVLSELRRLTPLPKGVAALYGGGPHKPEETVPKESK